MGLVSTNGAGVITDAVGGEALALVTLEAMCKAAPANRGLRNSWENRALSKTTKEDAGTSPRSQISKWDARGDGDPSRERCCGRWFPVQAGGEVVEAGKSDQSFLKS